MGIERGIGFAQGDVGHEPDPWMGLEKISKLLRHDLDFWMIWGHSELDQAKRNREFLNDVDLAVWKLLDKTQEGSVSVRHKQERKKKDEETLESVSAVYMPAGPLPTTAILQLSVKRPEGMVERCLRGPPTTRALMRFVSILDFGVLLLVLKKKKEKEKKTKER